MAIAELSGGKQKQVMIPRVDQRRREQRKAFRKQRRKLNRSENSFESATGIIPGDRGKDGGSWCRPPLQRGQPRFGRQYHQLLWPVS